MLEKEAMEDFARDLAELQMLFQDPQTPAPTVTSVDCFKPVKGFGETVYYNICNPDLTVSIPWGIGEWAIVIILVIALIVIGDAIRRS